MRRYRFLALAAVLLSIGYWTFNDLVVERNPAEYMLTGIMPDPVEAGAEATLLYTGQQNYKCQGVIHRMLVDSAGTGHELPDAVMFTYNSDKPVPVHFERDITIPRRAASGPATIYITADRYCNVMQQWLSPTINYHELHFTIK